jgi:hypothetical protein
MAIEETDIAAALRGYARADGAGGIGVWTRR